MLILIHGMIIPFLKKPFLLFTNSACVNAASIVTNIFTANNKAVLFITTIITIAITKPVNAAPLVLFSNPMAISGAVLDAYFYSIIDKYDRKDEFNTTSDSIDLGSLRMCQANELSKISPKLVMRQCRIAKVSRSKDCDNKSGCVQIHIDESLKKDMVAWDLLTHAVKNPCQYFPKDDKFHWTGFYYPARTSKGFLNCGSGKLPYKKAIIIAGDKKISIKIN